MTLRGYWALAICILCGLSSISFASKFLLLFAVFIFVLLIVSIINMYFLKSNIFIKRDINPIKPDEDTEVLITLQIKGAVTDTVIKDYFDDGKRNAKFFFNKNSKEAVTNAQYKFRAKNRGMFTLGPILISESDWLGFFTRNKTVDNEEKLFVYPRVETVPMPSIPLQSSDDSSYFDADASSLSEDLFGLKEYEPGDDIRLIHWKTTSRTQKLFVRHHEPISTKSIAIVLDVDANSYLDDEFEPAIRLVASLCHAARSSSKKTIFLSNEQQEVAYAEDVFLDKLCSQQLEKHTVPYTDLYSELHKNQSDMFIITGSKAIIENSIATVFKVSSSISENTESNTVFSLKADTIFTDYRQWVEKWNVRETSVSH